jgi:hypothetical protein
LFGPCVVCEIIQRSYRSVQTNPVWYANRYIRMMKSSILLCVAALATLAAAQHAGGVVEEAERPSSHGRRAQSEPGTLDSLASSASTVGQFLWATTSAVSSIATKQVAGVVNEGSTRMVQSALSFLNLSKEVIAKLLNAIANLTFCAALLLGFAYLPPDVMLGVTGVTIFFGPALVMLLINLFLGLAAVAAENPLAFAALLFAFTFVFRSTAGQILGRRAGLDKNQDGRVNCRDCVEALKTSAAYQSFKARLSSTFIKLEDLEALATAQPASLEHLAARMDALEAKIDKLLAK